MFKVMVYEIQYLLGVHLINNQIIEYKLNLEQLSILNVVDLNENEIIRPITYQINQDYFSIAVRHDMKTFIILFSIQKTSLKLINTIQIGRDSFFFHEQYLIYYDKEDILIMFNMANFEIQIENVHLFKSHKQSFNFNIVPINSNESSISLQFTLRHYNKCYQLQKKTNNASLYYSFHNKTKIYPTNYFYGPIDTLKLLENDKFQIEGPLVVSKVSLDAEEGKIYTMNLNTIFRLSISEFYTQYFKIILFYYSIN
ncbi:unnamed protein product [Paramecium octaurelia]|uniref:Uncharacterized protein n=1 Tax=Paramecium octaurelia TaxID=43137 RepID=A0A8S1XU01_PAROT|nr:unnamed protein product [Paramecium octaurelia]